MTGDAVRDAVLGPEAADRPDGGRRVRHGYFTHRNMQLHWSSSKLIAVAQECEQGADVRALYILSPAPM
ncbi:hypothetical protein ACWD04_05735 [Streptomyces sp. NPDC002911]